MRCPCLSNYVSLQISRENGFPQRFENPQSPDSVDVCLVERQREHIRFIVRRAFERPRVAQAKNHGSHDQLPGLAHVGLADRRNSRTSVCPLQARAAARSFFAGLSARGDFRSRRSASPRRITTRRPLLLANPQCVPRKRGGNVGVAVGCPYCGATDDRKTATRPVGSRRGATESHKRDVPRRPRAKARRRVAITCTGNERCECREIVVEGRPRRETKVR